MKPVKSERLRKLEAELADLKQWMNLGLVPKKDLARHESEIQALESKVHEEKERLQFLKDGGDADEFMMPKRSAQKVGYEMPTISDEGEGGSGLTEGSFDMDTYFSDDSSFDEDAETDHTEGGTPKRKKVKDETELEDESYFSDRNRWRRGGIIDPDADEW